MIFWNFSYGFLWTIPKTFSIVWLSWDISKDNSKNNYLITTLILITTLFFFFNNYLHLYKPFESFFFNNYLHCYNYLTLFLYSQTRIQKCKLTCVFSCPWYIYIYIQIKFDIDINNDELLKTIWKHKKKEKKRWSSSPPIVRSNSVKSKLVRSKFVRKQIHCTENMCKRLEFVCVCVCVGQRKSIMFQQWNKKGIFGLDLQGTTNLWQEP